MHMICESRCFLSLHRWCPMVKNNLRTGPFGRWIKLREPRNWNFTYFEERERSKSNGSSQLLPQGLAFLPGISSFSLLYDTVVAFLMNPICTANLGHILNGGFYNLFLQELGCVSTSSQSGYICEIDWLKLEH